MTRDNTLRSIFIAWQTAKNDNERKQVLIAYDKAVHNNSMTEAIGTMGCGKNALADALPIVVEAMEMVETEILAHLPQQSRKGPVRASLAIEEIGVLA